MSLFELECALFALHETIPYQVIQWSYALELY